jgi:O-antigen/teichoic acid export membrane protein
VDADGRSETGGGGSAGDAAHAARGAAVQILTGISQSLMVVTHVVVARLFGPLAFGTYQTCVAIVDMLTRAGTGGADRGMLRYVAGFRARGEEESVDRALGTGLRLGWRLAIGLAALLIVAARLRGGALFGAGVAAVLPVMAPVVVLTGTTLILMQASIAVRVVRVNLLVRGLAEPALLLVMALGAWALGGGARALGGAHAVAAALTAGTALALVGGLFGYRRFWRALRAPALPGFARFTIPLGLGEMLNAILQRADVVIITRFLGAEAAAYYVAGEFLSRTIANVRYAFDSVVAGLLSEALHRGERTRLRYNLRLMTRWVITATLPLAITVVAVRHDLLALYGPAFQRAADPMIVLIGAQVVSACLGLGPWTLVVAGRSRVLLAANLLGAIVNVSLGLVLVPRLGLMGGAISALVTVIGFQAFLMAATWQAERVHPFDRSQWKPLAAAAAALLAQALVPRPGPAAARVAAAVACTLVVYGAALLALGLPDEERKMLARLRAYFRDVL